MAYPVSKDPSQVFLWLDKQLDILKACGGSTDELFLRRVISAGLESTCNSGSVFESGDFWFSIRGTLNQKSDFNYESVKNDIWSFWDSHRNKRVVVDCSLFNPAKKLASANLGRQGAQKKSLTVQSSGKD